jgi:hypothetical protein
MEYKVFSIERTVPRALLFCKYDLELKPVSLLARGTLNPVMNEKQNSGNKKWCNYNERSRVIGEAVEKDSGCYEKCNENDTANEFPFPGNDYRCNTNECWYVMHEKTG